MAWGVVTIVLLLAGAAWLALWMAVAAAVSAAEVARSFRDRPGRRGVPRAVTAACAPAIVLAGAAGWPATVLMMVLVAVVLATVVSVPLATGRLPVIDLGRTLLTAEVVGLSAASPVILRHHDLTPALVLVLLWMFYDSGAYLIGTGANNAWEGPAAAAASMAALTVAVAAAFNPPFRGATPWLLGALAIVTAPLGPVLSDRLVGEASVRLGGFRRLDSLLVLGPVWAAVASIVLH